MGADVTDQFIIASLKHTSARHLHITMWAPDECGYRQVISRAGLYTAEQAKKHNDGEDCIAVPAEIVVGLGVAQPKEGWYDFPGNVLENSRETWIELLRHRIVSGRHKGVTPYPYWRGRSPARSATR